MTPSCSWSVGVALLTYALHGFNGMLTRDLAVYSYAGQQVAEGVPPYLGILNRAGPLAHVIPGIGVGIARIGGFDDVLTMRLLFMVIATLCVCAVYVLGARRVHLEARRPRLLRPPSSPSSASSSTPPTARARRRR